MRMFFRPLARSKPLVVGVLSVVSVFLATCPCAQAFNRDQRTVATAGLYGTLVGTLVGLVTLPVTQSGRNVFVGSSVGLYLGLAVGLYHMNHRDDPDNPLRYQRNARRGPDPNQKPEFPVAMRAPKLPSGIRFDVPVVTF